MSRVGKNPIVIPNGVNLDLNQAQKVLSVKGPLGSLDFKLHDLVDLEIETGLVKVVVKDSSIREQNALWGTSRAIINNLIQGVSKYFEVELELNGVGYRMELAGDKLTLFLGFSHPIIVDIPEGVKIVLEKNLLKGTSIDKQLIGNFFANIFALKPCDVYKHKGFKYPGRFYKKKVGKKGK